MNAKQGLLELSILNAKTVDQDFTDTIVELIKNNVPPVIVTRLEGVWETTQVVAGETVNIGKIIVNQIVEFVRENQELVIGMALGAAFGALTNLIPFIGHIIAPMAIAVGALIGGAVSSGDNAFVIACNFFKLFADIVNATVDHWKN